MRISLVRETEFEPRHARCAEYAKTGFAWRLAIRSRPDLILLDASDLTFDTEQDVLLAISRLAVAGITTKAQLAVLSDAEVLRIIRGEPITEQEPT